MKGIKHMKTLILAATIVAAVAMNTPRARAGFSASFVDPLTHLSVSIGDHGYRAPAPAVVYAPAPPVCYTPAPVVVYRAPAPVYYGGPRFIYRDYGHRDFDWNRDHRFDRGDHRGWGGDRDDHRGGDRDDHRGGDRDNHGGYHH